MGLRCSILLEIVHELIMALVGSQYLIPTLKAPIHMAMKVVGIVGPAQPQQAQHSTATAVSTQHSHSRLNTAQPQQAQHSTATAGSTQYSHSRVNSVTKRNRCCYCLENLTSKLGWNVRHVGSHYDPIIAANK